METLPAGWTVYTCEQERAETGLLKGESDDTKANTHVQDLFHEDAKARCGSVSAQMKQFLGSLQAVVKVTSDKPVLLRLYFCV